MMSTHISVKNSLLMLLCGLVFAAASAFLLNFLLRGPRLGPHFDFLLEHKKSAVSREILIINTDDYVESSDIYSVLMTLTEMEASCLVLTARMPSSASPLIITETDIRRRFGDEYILLGSNIRNLFEGIRMGYVTPAQAPFFVEQVIEFAGQGRDRLISALVDRDEELLRSVTVFGNFLQAEAGVPIDDDGMLRRVKPVDQSLQEEHPVYAHLKNRYAFSQIETSGSRQVLWLRSHDAKDIDIPLDDNGNIITAVNSSFRNIDIDLVREYEQAKSVMRNTLERANELRVFLFTPPEKIPLFIDDHAAYLLEELLMSPDSESRYAWVRARADYLASLVDFFNSPAESLLMAYYDGLIADFIPQDENEDEQLYNENLEQRVTELVVMKNDTIEAFNAMHEAYEDLLIIYDIFNEELALSFCIMGPPPSAQYSAHLANALITGAHIKPVSERYSLVISFAAAFAVLLIVFLLRPLILLPAGILISAVSSSVFAYIFIFHSYWIDPFITLVSAITGVIIIFFVKTAYLNYRARAFRMAYRTSVSKDVLRNLIKSGRPRLSEVNDTYSAVIAIKDINLLGREDNEKSRDKGKTRKAFYTAAKKAVFSSGAVIAGYEGDTILVCFGSPIDKSYHPVSKACKLARELIKNEKIQWRFGIDAGMCSFSWSQETGYCVSGRPAVRARVLVSKTPRFKTRTLVTNNVLEKLHIDGKKIGTFNDESGSFYELPLANSN